MPAAIRYLSDPGIFNKKTGRDSFTCPALRKLYLLRERQLICSTPMGGGKQLPCARVDGQPGNREPDNAEAGPRIPVARDIVERDSINRLIADRCASAFEVRPRRRAGNWVVRHREDVAGVRVSKRCSDEFVVAQIRHVGVVWVSWIDCDAANRAIWGVRIQRVETREC